MLNVCRWYAHIPVDPPPSFSAPSLSLVLSPRVPLVYPFPCRCTHFPTLLGALPSFSSVFLRATGVPLVYHWCTTGVHEDPPPNSLVPSLPFLIVFLSAGRRLAIAWALAASCLVGHAAHFLSASGVPVPPGLHLLHSPPLQAALSLAAMLGPGRKLLTDGWACLRRGSPNMNTLVGLGAVSSFAVSTVAALLPRLVRRAAPATRHRH